MAVLVTRATPGDQSTLEALRTRGGAAISSPVLVTELCAPAEPDWSGVQALLVTSANAAAALQSYHGAKAIPVLAVGDHTAAALKAAGFGRVESAQGDAAALLDLAAARLSPGAGKVVYLRGEDVATDLAGALRGRGFATDSLIVYRTVKARLLTDQAISAIRAGEVSGVLFHSRRGAEAFLSLAVDSALAGYFNRMTAFALSARAAEPLDPSLWRAIQVAPSPNEASLLSIIAADA
jgi:uroporphyrinogen-III synthase